MLEGLRFLRGRKNLQMSFYVDIAAMLFGMPRALFPAIAVTFYPGSALAPATIVGLLSAAPAVGAVVSSALSGPLSRARRQGAVIVGAIVVWGVTIALFGWPTSCGSAAPSRHGGGRGQRQRRAAPDGPAGGDAGRVRGRLQGIFTVVVAGGRASATSSPAGSRR